jgi:transposase InsO family protein
VSDITYIKTQEGNCYLSLITDAYSRKIMGYSIADNMEATTVAKALKMALKSRLYPDRELIHHSDRGIQYCSREYVEIASKANMRMSMTQSGDPYENALAERMNRTIKEEFCLDKPVASKKLAVKIVKQAVWLYNNKRPHLNLSFETPEQVHKKNRTQYESGSSVKPVNLF